MRHAAADMPDPANTSQAIVANITSMISDAFPNVSMHTHSIAETLGNNDVLPDYYLPVEPDSPALDRLPAAWQDTLYPDEVATVLLGGYFSRELMPGLLLLSINTIVYSLNHEPDTRTVLDPFDQFAWMRDTLTGARASGQAAYIIGHIPPVVDSYSRKDAWQALYSEQYFAVVRNFSDVVVAQLFGHLHADQFRCMHINDSAPILLMPAVTPIYGNNPSFRIVEYDDATFRPTDMCTYVLDDSTSEWRFEYCTRQRFGLNDLSNSALLSIAVQMAANATLLADVLAVYNSEAPNAIPTFTAHNWACLYGTATRAEFETCLDFATSSSKTVFVILVSSMALVVLAFVSWRVYRQRRQKAFQYDELEQDFDESIDESDLVPTLKLKITSFK